MFGSLRHVARVLSAGPVVHVLDASRSVPVAQTLLDKKTQVRDVLAWIHSRTLPSLTLREQPVMCTIVRHTIGSRWCWLKLSAVCATFHHMSQEH